MYPILAAHRRLLLGIGIACWLGAETALAGALIEFPNLSAQAKPVQLLGYLARPDQGLSAYLGGHAHGAGPYPAVVVLHGCSGLSSHSTEIADQIAA